MNLTKFGGPYINYADTVRSLVIEAGAYPSPEWFKGQTHRIAAAYDIGEPVEMCAATIAEFGRHYRPKQKTPAQLAVRRVRCA